MSDMDAKLKEYAALLVEVGLNVQPGQTPRIRADISAAPLARACVAACYDRGAREVIMEWSDEFETRQRYLRAEAAVFSEYPAYAGAKLDWLLDRRAPNLTIIGGDPELLRGVDPERIQTWQRVSGQATRPYYDAMTANRFPWSIGACPTAVWAEKVFPDKRGDEAVSALWDAILSTCRVTGDGKAAARWHAHVDATARRAEILNRYRFRSLHYTNALGTDLTVRLPEDHVWAGGADKTPEGVLFVANIPTEEIFTAPRWDGVDGRVYAALPLALNGNVVEGFYLDFRGGRIVDIHAEKGAEFLRRSIEVDEGSSFLGEVALVPYDSPIRRTGLLFFETLFDENASCHLAFGSAYPNSVRGGENMTPEEQKAAGLNQSINHVDFMVGTRDLNIVGTTHDGREVPVFVDGNFAF